MSKYVSKPCPEGDLSMGAKCLHVKHTYFAWILAFGICSTGPRALAGHQPAPPALWGGEGEAQRG